MMENNPELINVYCQICCQKNESVNSVLTRFIIALNISKLQQYQAEAAKIPLPFLQR